MGQSSESTYDPDHDLIARSVRRWWLMNEMKRLQGKRADWLRKRRERRQKQLRDSTEPDSGAAASRTLS